MKILIKNMRRMMEYAVAAIMLLLPVVSCSKAYDDSAILDELEKIEQNIAALEERLAEEITSLQELIAGKITITKLEPKSDGSILVLLSNGSSFTVNPKGVELPDNLITVADNGDGVLCWAHYNSDGELEFILADGDYIPVSTVAPEVRVAEDGVTIEISFDGGASWMTTGYAESAADALIADIEVVYSDWQTDSEGNALPLYCVITLADGADVKVGMNSRVILDYDSAYVAAGGKYELVAMAEQATDFMMTTPKGWGCDVKHEVDASRFTLTFSAPSSSDIRSGEAVGEGVAKLVVIFNNGMSSIASIKLSTTPVYYSYFLNNITLTVGAGVDELVCGLVESASFSADMAAANANKYLSDNTQNSAYGVSFAESLSVTINAETLCSTLSADKEYTFWYAIPKAQNGVKSVLADEISTEAYSYCAPSFELKSTSFFDAEVSFSVSGSNGYLVGVAPKAGFSNSACLDLYRDNKDSGIVLREDTQYNGSLLGFFGAEGDILEQNTTYVAWYLECGGCDDVSTDNLFKWEFTTKSFAEGGNLEITMSDEVVEYTNISAKLSTTGHIFMYYRFLESHEITSYPEDEDKLAMLIAEGTKCHTSDSVVALYDKAKQNTKLMLVAVAVDKNGKYGKVLSKEYTTKKIEYNSLTPTAEIVGSPSIVNSEIKVECAGAESFLYIYAESDGNKWKKTFGGTLTKAGEYIVINANTLRVNRVAAGNSIQISGLVPDVKYVAIIAAVDSNGLISKPVSVEFRPTIDLGDIVMRGDSNWDAGKPGIVKGEIVDRGDNAAYKFGWYCSPVKGYTAYTITLFKSHVDSEFTTDMGIDVPKLIAYIVENCDIQYAGTFNNKVNGSICEYSEDGYYYTVTEFGNEGEVTKSIFSEIGVYSICPQGIKSDSLIYTTWVDPDGNFHEPFVVSPVDWTEQE